MRHAVDHAIAGLRPAALAARTRVAEFARGRNVANPGITGTPPDHGKGTI
jgi:hypothetical protein